MQWSNQSPHKLETPFAVYGHVVARSCKGSNNDEGVREIEETSRKAQIEVDVDRVRSDLKQHQLDIKLVKNREACRKAIMDRDKIGKCEHIYVSRQVIPHIFILVGLH